MSNGYLTAAAADAAAAREIAAGFGLEVLEAAGIGDIDAAASALAAAPNLGLVLSRAAAADAAYVALLRAVAAKATRAQLIAVEPDARAAFDFLPAGWPVMSMAEAQTRAAALAASRAPAPAEPEPPPEPQAAPAPSAEPEPAPEAEPAPEPEPEVRQEAGGEAPEETPAAAPVEQEELSAPEPAPAEAAPKAATPPSVSEEDLAPPVLSDDVERAAPQSEAAASDDAESAPPPQAPAPAAEAPRAQSAPPPARKKEAATPKSSAPADATAFAPKKLRRGTPELVRIVIHQPKDLAAVIKAARKIDPTAAPAPQGMSIGDVALGASVGVALEVRGATCDGALQRRTWAGEPIDFAFTLEAESDARQAVILARVFIDDAQIGVIAFTRPISGPAKKPASDDRVRLKRHKRVFLSYSSRDRETVSAIATAYAMAGVEHFWDRTSLASGEEWSPRLRREIERADLFHLCWSRSAAASEWVAKEAEHAITRRRQAKRPDITVQMLDGPPWAPHPASLDSINFDDFVRAAIVGYARGED